MDTYAIDSLSLLWLVSTAPIAPTPDFAREAPESRSGGVRDSGLSARWLVCAARATG
ncbi:MAG: hypothetical protein JRI97_11085 [Deltaproteobacteria bacterium]|nr:hypothetical protein [Deltaproteobacteria bacterium]